VGCGELSDSERRYLAGQRPSRIRDVQAGALGWATVTLLDIEDGHAEALRLGLEAFGLRVERLRVGQSRHLIRALQQPAGDYVVLACHGDQGRILIPELAGRAARARRAGARRPCCGWHRCCCSMG
jgi:hypothetical protein